MARWCCCPSRAKRDADVPLIGDSASQSLAGLPEKYVESPEWTSGCLSTLTFGWMSKLIAEGHRRQKLYEQYEKQGNLASVPPGTESSLTETDLYQLRKDDEPDIIAATIKGTWEVEMKQPRDKIKYRRALGRAFQGPFIMAGVFKFMYDCLQFVGPNVLKRLLAYFENCNGKPNTEEGCDIEHGFVFVGIMLVTNLLQTFILQQYFHRCFRTGMRLNAATISLIYSKALRVSGASGTEVDENGEKKQEKSTGEIVNLMAVDSQRLQDTMAYLHTLWSGPLQIVLALFFLFQTVGIATLAGVFVMLIQVPIVGCLAARIKIIQRQLMKIKDERIKVTNETFGAVRLLKMYGWEQAFGDRITEVRTRELVMLRRYQILNIFSNATFQTAPILTAVATFGTYVGIYGELTPSIAFTALALFNVLRFPLTMFPNMVTSAVEANVAISRIQDFLLSSEVEARPALAAGEEPAIRVSNAQVQWPGGEPLFSNLSFHMPKGKTGERAHLTVVFGQVGSGKSGLMQALIGDLKILDGTVQIHGSVAYTAQSSWIRNASLQDNVIFTEQYDDERYKKVLDQCCLGPDLDQLPKGHKTEIGEKGVNLSGGQKQRVALARAIYSSADVLLLDDPLSAVDSEVQTKLLKMFRGDLVKGKSILLCTHALSALQHADQVVVLESDIAKEEKGEKGSRLWCGTPEEYKTKYPSEQDGGMNRSLSRTLSAKASSDHTALALTRSLSGAHKKDGEQAQLIEKEKEQVGSVAWKVYKSYIGSAGGWSLAGCVLFGVAFGQALQTMADYWVSFWSDHSNPNTTGLFISGQTGVALYTTFCFVAFGGVIATSGMFRLTALKAARSFHTNLLHTLLRLPTKFYDTTPMGRVLNRFSKDVYVIDETLQGVLYSYLQVLARVLTTFIVIGIATPWFLVIIAPMMLIYNYTQNYYIPASRQFKRIESNLRSPIFSHFSESLEGVTSIRAFAQQAFFETESATRVRRQMRAWYLNVSSNRWLAVRLETLGTAIVVCSGALAVVSRHSLPAGIAGLSISYALSVTQSLNWVVRMTSDREIAIVSVERVEEYINQVQEPEWKKTSDPPAEQWPSAGAVLFENIVLRYRPHLPTVLNNLTMDIKAQQKVGICGRTGAGKSSVLNALLRTVEVESGRVCIDGRDLFEIGLHTIRHRISVIPQDPVLFSGPLKFNLDPLGQSDDAQLWQALKRAHMQEQVKAKVAEGEDALAQIVAEAGGNYSQGQRQQMCLARALLRSNKILLLDEATSAVDHETDALIQQTIRSEFASHTVLCIAHRIATIMEYDVVYVLEKGEVKENGNPGILHKDSTTRFHQLAKLDGVKSAGSE